MMRHIWMEWTKPRCALCNKVIETPDDAIYGGYEISIRGTGDHFSHVACNQKNWRLFLSLGGGAVGAAMAGAAGGVGRVAAANTTDEINAELDSGDRGRMQRRVTMNQVYGLATGIVISPLGIAGVVFGATGKVNLLVFAGSTIIAALGVIIVVKCIISLVRAWEFEGVVKAASPAARRRQK